MSKEGLHYPLYVERPSKQIDITKDQFYKLSYMGLACLWCSYGLAFHYLENGDIKLFTHNISLVDKCMNNHRFKGIIWYENASTEMYICYILKESKLFNTIIKYFSDYLMK